MTLHSSTVCFLFEGSSEVPQLCYFPGGGDGQGERDGGTAGEKRKIKGAA